MRLAQLLTARGEVVVQHQHAEIRRDRVEPAARHDARAGADRAFVVRVDDGADEGRFTGEIAVVDAALGARGDQWPAVSRVRTDGGADHPRAVDHRADRAGVEAVADDDR